MRIRFYLFFFLLSYLHTNGQKVDSDSLIRKIKLEITSFYINQGYLDKNTVKNSLNYVFATEIHNKKTIGYNTNGIYFIGVLISHSPQHILIKEKFEYKILEIKEIDKVLKGIIDYAMRNKIDTNLMFFYIKKAMNKYEEATRKPTMLLSPR